MRQSPVSADPGVHLYLTRLNDTTFDVMRAKTMNASDGDSV
jgi:hypothetical protein